jgi:hypothetical protein
MITILGGLASRVLGIEASGTVTRADYRDVLIPHALAMSASGPVNLLYVIGKDFTGYELGTLWDDAAFGMRHWRDFGRIAIVSDEHWVHAAITLFKPLVSCEVRLFARSQFAAANKWVSALEKVDA